MDWWHIGEIKYAEVRFGRKEKGGEGGEIRDSANDKGVVFKLLFGPRKGIKIDASGWVTRLEDPYFAEILKGGKEQTLTKQLVSQFEDVLKPNRDFAPSLRPKDPERVGYWPDDYPPVDKKNKAKDPSRENTKPSKKSEIQPPSSKVAKSRQGNWIYYGPPGTGKTFELNPILEKTYGKPPKGEHEL